MDAQQQLCPDELEVDFSSLVSSQIIDHSKMSSVSAMVEYQTCVVRCERLCYRLWYVDIIVASIFVR